jgi:glycerophosphoryl diester phosphodiesterase
MKTTSRILSFATAAMFFSLFTLPVLAVEIVAHRGASYDAPENNLSAMKLAWKQKTDAIELDIHLSKDGKIVVTHDYDTKRVGGVDKKIVDQTFDELQKLDTGSWKGKKFKGEKFPTLDSILATIPKGKRAFIEIKVGPEILPELGRVMKASGKKPEQLAMITFRYDTAKAAKEMFPAHQVYYLASYSKDKKTGKLPNIDDLIKQAKDANLDGLDLNFNFPIDKAFVNKVHSSGLKLYTWTVDDPAVAKAEVEAGVDGITTNRPKFLRDSLK